MWHAPGLRLLPSLVPLRCLLPTIPRCCAVSLPPSRLLLSPQQDHYRGRRHQKNVERLRAQEAAAAAAASAVAAASVPPGAPPPAGPFSNVPAAPGAGAAAAPSGGGGLQRSTSGITLGADGLRLSGGVLLSAGSLPRLPSGDIYEGFPCVRIGDVLLPSSMDLRAFLGERHALQPVLGVLQFAFASHAW